jgi:hypothetical protein
MSKPTVLKNWSVLANVRLLGNVYNHPNSERFSDGKSVITSAIEQVDGKRVTTYSGTVYLLEEPNPDYKSCISKYDPEDPVGFLHRFGIECL